MRSFSLRIMLLLFITVMESNTAFPQKINQLDLRSLHTKKDDISCDCVMKLTTKNIPSNWMIWGSGDGETDLKPHYWVTSFRIFVNKEAVDIPLSAIDDLNNINEIWIVKKNNNHFTIHLHGSQTGDGYYAALNCSRFKYTETGAKHPWTGYVIKSRYVHSDELTNVNETTTYHGFGY